MRYDSAKMEIVKTFFIVEKSKLNKSSQNWLP